MAPTVHILIPAAGASRRMGGKDKLTEDIGGKALLRHVVETALATGARVFVTLPLGTTARHEALDGLAVHLVDIPDADQGMSRSLVRGSLAISADASGPQDGLMILPADMPDFTTEALGLMIQTFQATPEFILRGGTASGLPGHPVIFPRALWPDLQSLTGDAGARALLHRYSDRVRVVRLPGEMAMIDLDTPLDWEQWRTRKGS